MTLNKRRRTLAVDVLQIDYEYCTISYYANGARNDLGEPSRTLAQRATNVKCSIDPITRVPSYIGQNVSRAILRQGIIERSAYIMTLPANQAIEPGDVVTDYDSTVYDVVHIVDWYTHKEAFLKKIN